MVYMGLMVLYKSEGNTKGDDVSWMNQVNSEMM